MTPEQKAAYVMAESACAMAKIAGMQAENQIAAINGHELPYSKREFEAVMSIHCISHNDVLTLFR